MEQRVVAILVEPSVGEIVRYEAERAGMSAQPDLDGVVDVVVVDAHALERGVLQEVRVSQPLAILIVVAPLAQQGFLGAVLPEVFQVVPVEHVASWIGSTLARARAHRELRDHVDRWRDTTSLLVDADPAQLPAAVAETMLRVLRADAAVAFLRGPDGKLLAGPVARAVGERRSTSDAEDPSHRGRSRRRERSDGPAGFEVPTESLRRRSERLARGGRAQDPVRATVTDCHAIGMVVSGRDRSHGVLWAIRAAGRPAFADESEAGIRTVARFAQMSLDHLRVVRDLQHRVAALRSTRRAMEDDKRAARVGRLATEALRNLQVPLAYTRTNLRQLQTTDALPAEGAAGKHLQYALDGLHRAERIIEDAARVSEGRDRVPIEVRQLMDAALALVGTLSPEPILEVDTNAVILANATRLAEGLAALLFNASEAPGVAQIHLRVSRQGDQVVFEVVDDGEGIPDDIVPRVMEPFFSTRGKSGLGLTTTRDAVEASGGSLQLWSRPGIGTTVIATLPAQEVDDAVEIEAFEDDDLEGLD